MINTAGIEPGSRVAVFGLGGVGLSAVMGAQIAGAQSIIVVDTISHKLDTARKLGATEAANASTTDVPCSAIYRMAALTTLSTVLV